MKTTLSNTAQGHLTLTFPMKSPADCAAVRSQLQASTAELYRAADAMGTLHYCRFIALDDLTVCMLADYDGELESVLDDLPRHFGPVLDPLLAHVSDASPTPVADHAEAFVAWATCSVQQIHASATRPLRALTARQIKSLATAAGIELDPAGAAQLPLLVIMPMKGRVATSGPGRGPQAVEQLSLQKAVIRWAPSTLPTSWICRRIGSASSRSMTGHSASTPQDFADQLGPAFDLIFKFTATSPPTPTSKNAAPFTKWVADHDLAPLAFYSAYPGLLVQDIKALLADGASVQAG